MPNSPSCLEGENSQKFAPKTCGWHHEAAGQASSEEDTFMSIFPTKIVLATHGSEDAELAATTAVNLAKSTGSELHVVDVFPGPAYVHPYYETHFPEAAERLRREARKGRQEVLDERVERIGELGGSVAQTHIREGETDAEIVTLAEELEAGLIAIGSRGLGGLRRALMGNVSDSVVRHAHCPVMVVRAEAVEFPTKILVATDRSREAKLAATTAADLAKSTNSELHVVHVGFEQKRDEAQKELDEEVDMIRESGAQDIQAHLEFGMPDTAIVALAEELGAGVIAMGSRGLGGVRRALLGSISDSVVRHAHCPVLVVRQEE
jgi:nucleotide-binding universal stress UspA family protein